VELASIIDLSIKNIYVSVLNGYTANTLWIRDVHIHEGKIHTENFAWFIYQHKDYVHDLYVLLEEAKIDKPGVNIKKATVVSSLYRFVGSGRWEKGGGLFYAEGYISSIKNDHVYIPDIYVTGSGVIDLSDIHIEAEGKVDFFHLRGRKIYRNAEAKAYVHVKFGSYTRIEGNISVEDIISADRKILFLELKDVYIDNRIIGVDFPFRAKGNLSILNERDGKLDLTFLSDKVNFLSRFFAYGKLDLSLYYAEGLKGTIKVETGKITRLSFEGNFDESEIKGNVNINNLFINTSVIKGSLDFSGYMKAEKGSFNIEGEGILDNPYIYGFYSDSVAFRTLITEKEKT